MWEVVFDEEAIDFLNALPKELKERIFDKIISAKEYPFHFFERLAGREEYKLRIGDYRIIVDLEPHNKVIRILIIGHRKNVYQKI